MKEKMWAYIGKGIVFLGVVIGLILGILQLNDRLQNPSVFGVGEIHDYSLNPKIKELYDSRIKKEALTFAIKEHKKKGESADKILTEIENSTILSKSFFPNLELDQYTSFSPIVIHFIIYNKGADIAREVKLILPGEGSALFRERALVGTTPKSIDWTSEIPLGDLRPQATLEVSIWPKLMIAPNLASINPAIIHSKGIGKVFENRSFFGWGANCAFWFASHGVMTQAILLAALIFLVALPLFGAFKLGYIVLKPLKKDTALGVAPKSGNGGVS
jgi:hypothetical protein